MSIYIFAELYIFRQREITDQPSDRESPLTSHDRYNVIRSVLVLQLQKNNDVNAWSGTYLVYWMQQNVYGKINTGIMFWLCKYISPTIWRQKWLTQMCAGIAYAVIVIVCKCIIWHLSSWSKSSEHLLLSNEKLHILFYSK